MKDRQSTKPRPFGLLTDVSWADRVQWNLFHLKSCTEGDGSHQRKVIFRIVLLLLFFKVEYLKHIFLVCVWMVMARLRCLHKGLGSHVGST